MTAQSNPETDGSSGTKAAQPVRPVTLQTVNNRLKAIVEAKTAGNPFHVRARATEVQRTRSGHIHLKLREDKYGLPCVIFRDLARQLPFWVQDGQTLLIQGEIEVDAAWGEYQLVAREVLLESPEPPAPTGETLLARAREAGWLDRGRKRPLPRPPQAIGLIAGPQSKARADILGSLKDNHITAPVIFRPVTMPGPGLPQQLVEGIEALNLHPDTELIVIGRGGGRKAELSAFNTWEVGQAIVDSAVPVLTAIGHRQDRTLADRVADHSVDTPSLVGSAISAIPAHPVRRWQPLLIPALILIILLLVLLTKALALW